MIIRNADFSWPVESVLIVDDKGLIKEERHTIELNVKPIFYAEFKDSNSVEGKEVRIICDKAGHYYITGVGFKNIYQFMPTEGGMKLDEKIKISDSLALRTPAFNQKITNIELLDGSNKFLIKGSEIVRIK
jgi:hypothetical protein